MKKYFAKKLWNTFLLIEAIKFSAFLLKSPSIRKTSPNFRASELSLEKVRELLLIL